MGEKRLPRHFERYELRDRCWDVGMRCLFFLMAADIISLIFLAPKKRNTVLSHFFRTKAHLCAILILVMMRRTCAALYKIRYMKGLKWVEFNSDFSMGWNGLKWVEMGCETQDFSSNSVFEWCEVWFEAMESESISGSEKNLRDLQHPGPSLHKMPFLQMLFTQIFGNFSFLKP